MPWPAAMIEIQFLRITNLDLPLWNAIGHNMPPTQLGAPSLAIGTTDRVYVVGSINGRFMGRSRRVAGTAATVDLTTHPDPDTWKRVLRVRPNDPIDLELRVIGDTPTGPLVLQTFQHRIVVPPDDDAPVVDVDWGREVPQDLRQGDLHYRATVTLVPRGELDPAAFVRAIFGSSDEGSVVDEGHAVNLEITEVRGLYQPRHAPGALVAPPGGADGAGGLLSDAVPGYKSDDDRGRIFVNQNFLGTWADDNQQVDLTVTVNFLNVAVAGTEVQWTLVIPDDPLDDRPDTHRLAGRARR